MMNPIYFRYEDGGEKFQVAFEYNDEKYNISRQFNMDRSIGETTSDFKNRVKSNVLKAVEKKIHNLNKKKDKDSKLSVPDIRVDIIINGNYFQSWVSHLLPLCALKSVILVVIENL